MARMTGFVFQDEYLVRLAKLSDQELGRLVRALAIYHLSGEEQDLAGRESVAYDFIKADIDKADQSYAKKCENMKRQPHAIAPNCPQLPTDDDNGEQLTPNINSNSNSNTNNNLDKESKENSLKRVKEKPPSRFTPPTIDEVETYCLERMNGVNAQVFIDFYSAKGWKIGNSPMKDWKAAVRTWEQRDNKTPQSHVSTNPFMEAVQRGDFQ